MKKSLCFIEKHEGWRQTNILQLTLMLFFLIQLVGVAQTQSKTYSGIVYDNSIKETIKEQNMLFPLLSKSYSETYH